MSEGVANAFLKLYATDNARGVVRTLDEYRQLWTGYETIIEREWRRLSDDVDDEPASQELPRPFGEYELRSVLGIGGQGTVYEAFDPRVARRVAIKVMHAFAHVSRTASKRFIRGAEASARLHHPGICTIFEAGTHQDIPYVVMQYVDGWALDAVLRAVDHVENANVDADAAAHPPVVVDDVVATMFTRPHDAAGHRRLAQFFADVAEALDAAHAERVVHRDIKPGNIFVTKDARPVLLDFGLARLTEAEASSPTVTGDVFGTPSYMAPEQVRGRTSTDLRSDLYALGCVMYQAWSGRPPHVSPTREGLYRAIAMDEPMRLGRRVTTVPKNVDVIVETLLEKEPDRRYQRAADVARDLRAIVAERPIAVRARSAASRLWRWARRRPALAGLATLLAIGIPVLAVLGGMLLVTLPAAREKEQRLAAQRLETLIENGFRALDDDSPRRAEMTFTGILERHPHHVEALAGRALALRDMGREDDALGELEDALDSIDTEPAALRRILADLLEAVGDHDEAEAVFENLPSHGSPLFDFLRGTDALLRMDQLSDIGEDFIREFEEARASLDRAVLNSPRARPLYHFARARVVEYTGDADETTALAATLERLFPDSRNARYWSARLRSGVRLEDQGDGPSATDIWATFLEREGAGKIVRTPSGADVDVDWDRVATDDLIFSAVTSLVDVLEADKRYGAGLRLASRLLEVGGVERSSLVRLARCELGVGRTDAAIGRLRQWRDDFADDAVFLVEYVDVLREAGRYEAAILELDAALTLRPKEEAFLFRRAELLEGNGRLGRGAFFLSCRASGRPRRPCQLASRRAHAHRDRALGRSTSLRTEVAVRVSEG